MVCRVASNADSLCIVICAGGVGGGGGGEEEEVGRFQGGVRPLKLKFKSRIISVKCRKIFSVVL